MHAGHSFISDTGKSVLELCQRNVETNTTGGRSGSITVRELDWRRPFSESCETHSAMQECQSGLVCDGVYFAAAGFCWSQEDMDSLSHVSLILASDGS